MIAIGTTYTFAELEKLLGEESNVLLKVENLEQNCHAIMLITAENFSSSYQSGDGMLVYAGAGGTEVMSANNNDEFKVLEIITI